jgi:peptidoglycan/LPS O-acetylase OafA/YrhL
VSPTSRHRSLDGLRALALALVLAYHLDVPGFGGGFVGVDLFFVLSGYLITSLLVDEHRRTGGVSLRAFWVRRVRRLWPLSWITLCLVALAGIVGVWNADQRSTLPGQTAAATAQVANWWQMLHGGYVERFSAPSPLRHMWSLSVEEQFYVFWPLLLVGALVLAARLGRRAGRSLPWLLVGVLSLASVALGFMVGPAQAYLGTGTRAIALLTGAALALAWANHPLDGPGVRSAMGTRRTRVMLGVAGLAGAAVLAVMTVVARPEDPWLGRGGFALIAVASTALVAAVVGGPFELRDGLALAPFVWVGERSYAVYLLHWPLIVALGPSVPLWLRTVLVLGASFAGAELLRRLVEVPVTVRRVPARVLSAGGAALALVTVVALVVAAPSGTTPNEQVAKSLAAVPDPTSAGGPGGSRSAEPGRTPRSSTPVPTAPPTTCPPATSAPPTTFGSSDAFDMSTIDVVVDPNAPRCGGTLRVMVVGDSTARGIANGLVALGDSRIQVWDRSVLGCALNDLNYGKKCPDWRSAWTLDVLGLDPDVVVLYSTVAEELQSVDDPPFLAEAAKTQRVEQMVEAVRTLQAGGAKVLLTTTPVPWRPNGLFYCSQKATNSRCDPAWVNEWNRSLVATSAVTGAGVLDAAAWIGLRKSTNRSDRPDGLHLSGQALVQHSQWLVPQLLAAAGRPTS